MGCGGVNEPLVIALPFTLTGSNGITIMLEVWEIVFARPGGNHGNDSALLEEILGVPAAHIEGSGG